MVTYDEDKEALAAEYVLGTLSADERDQAEALLSIDPRFESAVRQWERRLGELNVMVEAVEPSPQVWENIMAGVASQAPSAPQAQQARAVQGGGAALPQVEETELHAPQTPGVSPQYDEFEKPEEPETAAEPNLSLLLPEFEPGPEKEPSLPVEPAGDRQPSTPPPLPLRAERRETGKIERSADVIYLARRVKRWRRLTLACGAIAALLAIYVAIWQTAPELIPPQLRPAGAGMVARNQGPARAQQDRLVAVLQQEPTAPAFLMTLDTRTRTLFVRRISATPEAGRSYQLWLISKKFSGPRSLGVIGDSEFTQRALPASYDVDTLRTASYAVSLEPAGGSPNNGPTGPVLFTGNAVESLPASPPSPKT